MKDWGSLDPLCAAREGHQFTKTQRPARRHPPAGRCSINRNRDCQSLANGHLPIVTTRNVFGNTVFTANGETAVLIFLSVLEECSATIE